MIVVLVRTDEGLTGIGEASLAGKGRGVLGAIDHFRELLVGQEPGTIEHSWSEMVHGTFWLTGQVVMSALAGLDGALWDLKGKRLGVPVYDLLGGPTRDRVRVYRHLRGDGAEELVEDARAGRRRLPRSATARWPRSTRSIAPGTRRGRSWRRSGARRRCAARSATRSTCSSTCTRCSARPAAYLGHALEPYRLFFYEDPIGRSTRSRCAGAREGEPPDRDRRAARAQMGVPAAGRGRAGRLPAHDMVHAGGITEAKKILAAGESHSQRSALHHASSPINGAACLHLDTAIPNFGIQEWMEVEPLYELFPNAPRAHSGYVAPPTGPGLGLEFDEAEARKRPSRDAGLPHRYWPDGSVGDY